MGKTQSEETKPTNSQAKREQRKKEAEKKKKAEKREKLIGNIIIAVVVLAIVCGIVAAVVKRANKIVAGNDYSACLDENGYIKNASAEDILLPDYKNIIVPLSEVEYSDESVQSDIESVLENSKVLNADESLTVADGDEVNIDYVGTIDGVEFDGGSSQGYDLTIGSGTFIEGFEDQLIGASVGSNFDINVTFPEDYSSTDLAGKDAVFNVTINGIEELPEFTDEFVAENLSEYASTTEEYKQYLKDKNYDSNLSTWIQNYLEENTTMNKYDKKYVKNLKSTMKYDDYASYETICQIYESYYGYSYYDSFESYTGMSEEEYDESLDERAKTEYKNNFLYQAICQTENATVNSEYYESVNGEGSFETAVESHGEPYALQSVFKNRATEIVKTMVTVQ